MGEEFSYGIGVATGDPNAVVLFVGGGFVTLDYDDVKKLAENLLRRIPYAYTTKQNLNLQSASGGSACDDPT